MPLIEDHMLEVHVSNCQRLFRAECLSKVERERLKIHLRVATVCVYDLNHFQGHKLDLKPVDLVFVQFVQLGTNATSPIGKILGQWLRV